MLPRLEAERELASINAMTMAFGGVKANDRRTYLARLRRAARGSSAPAAKATPDMLAAMGVAVTVVPPVGSGAPSAPRSDPGANRSGDPNG